LGISVYYETVFDKLYKNFIVKIIKENRKVEVELGQKLYNFDKIYGTEEIELDTERLLKIRWIKIPTFIEKNKPSYYTVYLVDVYFWRLGEMNDIYKRCMDCIDRRDTDSYTIFLAGKLRGFLDGNINKATRKNIIVFNECLNDLEVKHELRILKIISNFLDRRCMKMSIDKTEKKEKVFGRLAKDLKRISEFVDFLQNIERVKSLTPDKLGILVEKKR
jgi:hypothetical protein